MKQREFEEEDFGRLLSITKRLTLGEKKVSEVFCCRRKYVGGKMINRQWWCRLAFTNIYNECGRYSVVIEFEDGFTRSIGGWNFSEVKAYVKEIIEVNRNVEW